MTSPSAFRLSRAHLLVVALVALFVGVVLVFGIEAHTTHAATADFGLSQLDASQFGLRGDSPTSFFASIIRWILGVLGVVLVILLVYGGVMYMTSAGNEKRVETGKEIITWAIVGLVIVLAAFIIAQFVVGALTGGGTAIQNGTTGSTTNPLGRDWCTAEDDPKLVAAGFYCDYGIGGYDTQGTIRRRDQDYFFYEASQSRETNLPEQADQAIFGTSNP